MREEKQLWLFVLWEYHQLYKTYRVQEDVYSALARQNPHNLLQTNASLSQYYFIRSSGCAYFRSPRLTISDFFAENPSSLAKDTSHLSRRSHALSDPCTSPDLAQPRTSIPTPSPSPISPSVALPSPTSASAPPGKQPPKRKHVARAQDANHIPRPRNAFILFRSHALASGLVGTTQQNEASREIARIWRSADEETRKHFEDRAVEEKRRHAEAYPGYKYAPKKIGLPAVGPVKGRTGAATTSALRESRRAQPKATVRYCPAPAKSKRTLLTPEPTPELSPSLSSAHLDMEEDEPCSPEEDTEDDGPLFNMFGGFFESLPGSIPEETTMPEFSFPPEDEAFTIDQVLVPCLASSTYYNPTFVHANRRLRRAVGSDLQTAEEDELMRHALRPSVPLWHPEARRRPWDGPDPSLSALESARAPAATTDAMDVISETMSIGMFINDSF